MKNINSIFNIISIYALFLIVIGICGTFLSDFLVTTGWFGDRVCPDSLGRLHHHNNLSGSKCGDGFKYVFWGARHYWFNWGVFVLWLITLIRGIVLIGNKIDS